MKVLILINTTIFLILSFIHLYWVFGGKWAIDYAIPDKWKESYFDEKNKIGITVATLLVSIGLIGFALITALNYFKIEVLLNRNSLNILTQIIAGIFILRAIGNFNEFGIFKKKSKSKFTKKDNQLYIPLCLYLGITTFLIFYLKN